MDRLVPLAAVVAETYTVPFRAYLPGANSVIG
jgi:hypothetical protein